MDKVIEIHSKLLNCLEKLYLEEKLRQFFDPEIDRISYEDNADKTTIYIAINEDTIELYGNLGKSVELDYLRSGIVHDVDEVLSRLCTTQQTIYQCGRPYMKITKLFQNERTMELDLPIKTLEEAIL